MLRARRILAVALLLLAVPGCREATDRSSLVPVERVVLVSIDTLRVDHVGVYADAAKTPELDALAQEGVRFATAISPSPLTLPSHASLLTALDPPGHGVRNNLTFRLPDLFPTLAEHLHGAGFATAAFLGAMMLDRQYGLARGFDVYGDTMGRQGPRTVYGIPERPANQVVDAALAWLEEAPDRFFLWIHLFDPHAPWLPPGVDPTADKHSLYAGEVTFTDAELGRLIAAVRARHPGNGTLFVVTADHGESLGQHGEGTHGLGIYDATQHVPLLLNGAGLPRGHVVEEVVRLIDVAPTVLALASAEALPGVDGRDLLPLVYGEPDEPRIAYVETLGPQLAFGWSPLLGLRSARFKFISAPRPELYDLGQDPGETRNLLPSRADLAEELETALALRVEGARVSQLSLGPSDEDARLLEKLGYVVPRRRWGEDRLGKVGGADPKDKMDVRGAMQQVIAAKLAGRDQEALAMLAEIEDEGFEIQLFTAGVALETGNPALAAARARRAVDLEPLNLDAHRVLGSALLEQGKLKAAERAFTTAIRLNPEVAGGWIGLGSVAEREGDLEVAADCYARAADARGGSTDGIWRLAAVRIEQGRSEEAERLLEEFDPAELERPLIAERLARAEAAAGRKQQALARLEHALETHPNARNLRRARRQIRRQLWAENAAGDSAPVR